FLEGQMHALRLTDNITKAKGLYNATKNSSLYDKKLKMYKVTAPLGKMPEEIGRCRVFTPGWLENESIWLHMEYKYLLEILKSGLYEEFYNDFKNVLIPFQDPARYGRNILENSSFIVSSAYPDQSLWGKGFVARLSGVTVELLDIWIVMCLGKKPFSIDKDNNLCIKFSPILKADLFTQKQQTIAYNGKRVILEKNSFAFKLFSWILVVYHNPTRKDTFTNDARIEKIEVIEGGKKHTFNSNTIAAPLSYAVRDLKVERIDVYFEQMIHK
ncbi:MAG: hypothetical protein Q8O13_10190, partial [Candidatus Omnitrophota bacterium]|nr:hypothetical protein [Candidatus Omnitrophota bacterium]